MAGDIRVEVVKIDKHEAEVIMKWGQLALYERLKRDREDTFTGLENAVYSKITDILRESEHHG